MEFEQMLSTTFTVEEYLSVFAVVWTEVIFIGMTIAGFWGFIQILKWLSTRSKRPKEGGKDESKS